MGTCDRLDNEETEAETVTAIRIVAARPERLEDSRQELARDRPLIVHLHGHEIGVSSEPHQHRRSRRPVLNGIGGQVRNRLEEAMFIPGTRAIGVAIEGNLTVACDPLEFIDNLPTDRR